MSFVNTFNAFQIDNLTSGQKLTLSVIASFERNGKAWPSVATIAKRASMGIRTVQRHLAALINLGYITRTYRAGQAAVTRLFIGQTPPPTPAKLAPPPLPNWHPESGISESVNQIPAASEPATPEPSTETATAAIVLTENEQPITPQAITEEMPDVLAIDSLVRVSEVTDCALQQMEMPIKTSTASLEPSKEVFATNTLADVPETTVEPSKKQEGTLPLTQTKPECNQLHFETVTTTAETAETDLLADVPAQVLADLAEIRKFKKKAPKPTKTEVKHWYTIAQEAGWTMPQLLLTMVLRNWCRVEPGWIQSVPQQAQPSASPQVWKPEPHTPANPSTIAKMREQIAQMKARWNETPPPLPKGRGLA